jgi:predicted porin
MRNTKIALAVLALVASTAAMAEGVTIYGNLDVGLGKTSQQSTKFQGSGGFIAGNLWGLKGSEDIGGGTKASFVLEQGLDLNGGVDNGGNGTMFNRQGFVSLASDDLGSLAFGQQLSPFIAGIAGNTAGNGHFFVNRLIMGDPGSFNGAAGPTVALCDVDGNKTTVTANATSACGAGNYQQGGFFQRNAITYTSPSFNGWSAQVMQTTKQGVAGASGLNGAQAADSKADQYTAANIAGNLFGVSVNGVYQKRTESYSTMGFGFTVPVSVITLQGTYMNNKNDAAIAAGTGGDTNGKVNSYSLSASYNISDATMAALQYAANNATNATTSNQSLIGAHVQHKLSKRTSLYGSFTSGSNGAQSDYANRGTGSALSNGTTTRTYAAGVAHSF